MTIKRTVLTFIPILQLMLGSCKELSNISQSNHIGNGLYLGGSFYSTGGNESEPIIWLSNIGMWNGNLIEPVGLGPNGLVSACAVADGKLFVGGYFSRVDTKEDRVANKRYGKDASSVAMWDGNSWEPVGSGLALHRIGQGQYAPVVDAMAVLNKDLYVGGRFTTAGGATVNNIARWSEDSGWSAVGAGLSSSEPSIGVTSLCVFQDELYAGGVFKGFLAKWNGRSWEYLNTGLESSVYALVVHHRALYCGTSMRRGDYYYPSVVKRWSGGVWETVGATNNGGLLNCFASFQGELVVGGSFDQMGGASASNIAMWDGTHWRPIGAGFDGTVTGLASFRDELYAGGYFLTTGVDTVYRVAKWNGVKWLPMAKGVKGSASPFVDCFCAIDTIISE